MGSMIKYLESYPLLRPYPTHSNFILCDVLGADAAALQVYTETHPDKPMFTLLSPFSAQVPLCSNTVARSSAIPL